MAYQGMKNYLYIVLNLRNKCSLPVWARYAGKPYMLELPKKEAIQQFIEKQIAEASMLNEN